MNEDLWKVCAIDKAKGERIDFDICERDEVHVTLERLVDEAMAQGYERDNILTAIDAY